jgi:hypothetical protein
LPNCSVSSWGSASRWSLPGSTVTHGTQSQRPRGRHSRRSRKQVSNLVL